MGSSIKALHLLKPATDSFFFSFTKNGISSLPLSIKQRRSYSMKSSVLEPPDVPRLAETARISLIPQQVEEFAPKIRQVIDWFGQLQAVDLQSIEPALRADTEGDNLRDDVPEKFENREALISVVPSFEEPYIKVPKVLNKE
ncbi:glutamyl-tRNA(Gln) amidotransferase subunit C, chloroplastic/mitochondrial [Nicotiana tabacum]|uniref:Glutamyl-tRNA(Gln) amidotransferase subunit C, chloroplastic/mitochondrial n=2 Tax=Nicotiana TaxID=4085 RepID=A0A1S4DFL7_TOBAC|nr:PREDICTED: glutamyl-tRNA(Gln) amidotransferase subunit C, chloroplastic/mitochondrial [Nicotiana sylvestris]XP_016512265.1 PREDICTED: glutamyl-tRNA(Gln) amidotransferase subunit C, chloroplastic/mitochondrial-like [Nicotiana tabacum]